MSLLKSKDIVVVRDTPIDSLLGVLEIRRKPDVFGFDPPTVGEISIPGWLGDEFLLKEKIRNKNNINITANIEIPIKSTFLKFIVFSTIHSKEKLQCC